MNQTRRSDLTLELTLAISTLPRQVRHDLWRTCEPQHQRAVEAAVQAIRKRLEHGFYVEPKDIFVEWSSTK